MNNFKDFNVPAQVNTFKGEKVKVKHILNTPIKVIDFRIEPSKVKVGTQLLTLQIEKSGELRIVFTGSNILIDQINRVPKEKFPFETTIKSDNEYYEFT